jgi:spore photoproduct lyase
MTEEERTFQYGQFGYGKYKYTKEQLKEMEEFFKSELARIFPEDKVLYII